MGTQFTQLLFRDPRKYFTLFHLSNGLRDLDGNSGDGSGTADLPTKALANADYGRKVSRNYLFAPKGFIH